MDENEEIVEILSQCCIRSYSILPPIPVSKPEKCVICVEPASRLYVVVLRDSANKETEQVFCMDCISELFPKAFDGRVGIKFTGGLPDNWNAPLSFGYSGPLEVLKPKVKMKPSFEKVSFDDIPADDDALLAKLKEKSPRFTRCLASFLAGEVRFDDGTEHEFLDSVSKQVFDKQRVPSDAQISGFIKVYDTLISKKASGGVLHKESSDEHDLRLTASKKLLAIGCKRLHMFTPKTREIIDSMKAQFDKKGELSVSQVRYLRMIVEQLPPSMLTIDDKEETAASWADTKGY